MFNNELWQKPAGGAGGDFYEYQIANSVRTFESTNSKITRTPGTAGNRATWSISIWMKRSKLGTGQMIFEAGSSGHYDTRLFYQFAAGGGIEMSSGEANYGTTTELFRDVGAWYHIFIKNASNSNTLYVNGTLIKTTTLSGNTAINSTVAHGLGCRYGGGTTSYEGYIAEFLLFDGTAYDPTDVAETKNGVWIPKDPSGLTLSGTNTTWLKFASSGALGTDSSGEGNTWTIGSDISAHDQMLDSPTFNSDSNGGNFCTWNPLRVNQATQTFAEGNTQFSSTQTNTNPAVTGTLGATSGKWYWEIRIVAQGNTSNSVGVCRTSAGLEDDTEALWGATGDVVWMYLAGGNKRTNATSSSYGNSWTTGDILQVAMDIDNGAVYFGKNNTWQNSGDPTSGATKTGAAFTNLADKGHLQPYSLVYNSGDQVVNFGPNGTFNGAETAGDNADDTGYGNFLYDVPAGFLSLCTGNLPTADAVDPAQTSANYPQKLFSPILYTGTGSSNALTGLGFKPDFTWIKERGGANDHKLTDSSRGVTKAISSNTVAVASTTDTNGLTAFGTDGFTVGSDVIYNNSSDTYVSWNWRVNGGTTATNTEGSHNTTVQVDPSSAFSIVTWAQYSGVSTFGHGLGAVPELVTAKLLDAGGNEVPFLIYNKTLGATKRIALDLDAAATVNAFWNNTAPTSTVFTIGAGFAGSGAGISYCFRSVEGYSKIGSYEGNGNVDGSFVYTGFRPAWIMTKSVDSTSDWQMFDDKRLGYNVDNNELQANESDAETTTDMIDILSNGFKLRIATDPNVAETYIYMAFAENPFKYATAR